MPQELCENKSSAFLYKEDNDQVFALLGVRCQSLATCAIQLFYAENLPNSPWIRKDAGVLCFVKDNYRKNYFFRLYCLKRNTVIWEQEMYNNMEYKTPNEFLHMFEAEDYVIAFNFANVTEAKELKNVVERKLLTKRKREEKRNSRNSFPVHQEQVPRMPTNNDLMMYRKNSDPAERKAKRRRNITKADIGNPSEFRHVSHVGWDPDKGFDINCDDPQLNTFFQKAGVSEKQLQDRDTREFIYDFINKHGGREAVQEEVQKTRKPAPAPPSPITGPPVPPRGAGRPLNRAAPPPPPTSTPISRPPPISRINSQVPVPPPPPPPGAAPPPPPPPPPIVMPVAPTLPPAIPIEPAAPDMRSALMESIREGAMLKPVEVEERKPSPDSGRGDLLSEIRKGFHLKPVNEREVKPVSPPASEQGPGDLAGALARALAERNRVIHSEDDSTSDTDSNDDEWDA